MADGLFTSVSYIKENTLIDGNTDEKYLKIAIADAQRLHILPLLGTGLYNEISGQIVAGTLSSSNRTLLRDYVQDALKFWVLVEGLDMLTYKVTNKSIMKKDSDNSQPVEESELIRLIDKYRNSAEVHSERVTRYLIENNTSYPLFYNPGTGYDTVHPNYNNYQTGWNLDDGIKTYGLPIDKGDCCHE